MYSRPAARASATSSLIGQHPLGGGTQQVDNLLLGATIAVVPVREVTLAEGGLVLTGEASVQQLLVGLLVDGLQHRVVDRAGDQCQPVGVLHVADVQAQG